MQRCTIFRSNAPDTPCGGNIYAFVPVAIGTHARMHELEDALILGYVPVCRRHADMVPPNVALRKYADESIYNG